MNRKLAGIFILFILLASCRDYTPKPIGYNRIEPIESEVKEYVFPNFSFQYPSIVRIDSLNAPRKDETWFNIVYPNYNAVVYCTYLPITKDTFSKAVDDSYHMAYSHTLKASGIEQRLFRSNDDKVSGILYEIDGSVATPIQFFVTDSIRHFLRGSFYYSAKVDADSVAPITEFITKDIERMMSSFEWK